MYVIVTEENSVYGPFGTQEAAEIWATKRFGDPDNMDSSNPSWEAVPLIPSEDE